MRFTIDQIKNTIVEDFNELQLTDHYFFADSETDIQWSAKHEFYFVLKKDKTWKSYEPGDLIDALDDLTKKDLQEYMKDLHGVKL
tara:strand:+ start:255 stop:509 length:255 start_codon:yes stop_codon:yes gene_type:complete